MTVDGWCCSCEQGLGDEILFANLVPDMIEALGPEGKLILAVEPRLVSLFQRSFPTAEIGPHFTMKVDHHTVRAARSCRGLGGGRRLGAHGFPAPPFPAAGQ